MNNNDNEIEVLDVELPNKEIKLKPIPLKVKNKKKNNNIKLQTTIMIIISTILTICSIVLIINIVKELNTNEVIPKVEIETQKELNIIGSYQTTNDNLFSFNEDGTFYWFDNYEVLDNNYYSGTYTYRKGIDAINEMGYNEEDINKVFGENILIDNIYSIEITPTKLYRNNKDISNSIKNNKWWYILILKDVDNAIGYNKTIDSRYILKRH